MKLLKLGTIVHDSVSDTQGMLTHALIDMDKNIFYNYQPRGLSPETGQPVDAILTNRARIEGAEEIEIDMPLHALGTIAEDIATGFKGKIIGLTLHINGCLHADLNRGHI